LILSAVYSRNIRRLSSSQKPYINGYPDSVESHQNFIKKHGLPFPLLSDSKKEIVKAYQVWSEKSIDGEKYMGTERTTYHIGPHRKIRAILKEVKPAEHVAQLLKALAS
jgi:peroxiredoxin Q/BCP